VVEPAALHPTTDDELSVSSFFAAFAPAPDWSELPRWPPDLFALANLVLDNTGAYRFVVAPPPGKRWPPIPDWGTQMRRAGRAWREAADHGGRLPALVRRNWDIVTRNRDLPLASVRNGEATELIGALLALHALADEACAEIAASGRRASPASFESFGWSLLQQHGSLSRISPTRVRIVPKNHFSTRGMTIRSLSRHLALCYEAVDLKWGSIGPGPSAERDDYNIVLVPWPLDVRSCDFHAVPSPLLENMDPELFGFFEFAPAPSLDHDLVGELLAAATDRVERVDAVIFPESAIHPEAIAPLESILAEHGATFLIAGVRGRPDEATMGRNYLHFGVRTNSGWRCYEQDKHHRWCLDERQIRQYHLSRSLTPTKLWWEAIHVGERRLHVIDVGGGITTVPTVCEDLASLDEVAEMVRRVGPSLVVAVLLDGPQLARRWPCRYSSVLTDDPGAAVLTLTSYGMAARSRPPGRRNSRVVAHWNSPTDGVHEIELGPRASAVLVSTNVEQTTAWTADGRRHDDVPSLALSRVEQLRASR